MNEPILNFVLKKLEGSKGQIRSIAADTGIPYSTLAKIAQRVTPNPGVNHIQTLADYFRKHATSLPD